MRFVSFAIGKNPVKPVKNVRPILNGIVGRIKRFANNEIKDKLPK